MTDQFPLADSVNDLLQQICRERKLPPPDDEARRALASLTEEGAIQVLRDICRSSTIKNFSAFIKYMVNKQKSQLNGSICSPVKSSSPHRATPYYGVTQQPRGCTDDLMTRSTVTEKPTSSAMVTANGQMFSPVLEALGGLEFRKQFMILSYVGRNKLEDVLSVDEIRTLKNLSMDKFEDDLWRNLQRKNIKVEERRESVDWDSENRVHLYECHVSIDGSYRFKGPYLNKVRTHLQRVLGDDNVLNVKFEEALENKGSLESYTKYQNIAKKGIHIGLRVYKFFVFKDGGRKRRKSSTTYSVKCYFVRMESNASIDKDEAYVLSGMSMKEARSIFMHVHKLSNISKYMARFGLILSKTVKVDTHDNMESVTVLRQNDEYCRDANGNFVYGEDQEKLKHTDGTGFISRELAKMVPKNLFKGEISCRKSIERILIEMEDSTMELHDHNDEPPLLIQVRVYYDGCVAKGTLLVDNQLQGRQIILRDSMIKIKRDPNFSHIPTKNSLEIVNTSNKPRRKTYLSKNLIALLSYGGVPEEFFFTVLKSSLEDVQNMFTSLRAAYRASMRYGETDDYTVTNMILSGIPLDEIYLQHCLAGMIKDDMKDLKSGKLPISESYYLMGTADPTGTLKSDEVCVILEDGQISGKVLVYRNPGLHFGDIHVLKAVYVDALESFVGNSKYAIFFPCKGPRSLTDEIAGGDLDGDMYWVSRNPQLLEYFRESQRWTPESSLCNLSNGIPGEEDLEDELFELFLRTKFLPSSAMGIAADSWRALMDRLLSLQNDCFEEKEALRKNIIKLINIYYDALNAPKKGGQKVEVPRELEATMYPHYMEKNNERQFKSSSILGKIYDKVEMFEVKAPSPAEIEKLPCFKAEIPQSCLWIDRYKNYRSEMRGAMGLDEEIRDVNANAIIQKYKHMLYGAVDLGESPRNFQDILDDAHAIYNICYDYAKQEGNPKLCGFAWKVAGRALCELYIKKNGEKPVICCPSVLKEL